MSKEKPDWLPDLFPVGCWTENTFEDLYDIFLRDFVEHPLTYRGKSVWFFPEKDDDKEVLFWHLTHREDRDTGERLPDHRRSERLPWVREILIQSSQPEIIDWDYEEGNGGIRTYVWLKENNFLIVMKKYTNNTYRLITSFWVEYENTKRKLERKYINRLAP